MSLKFALSAAVLAAATVAAPVVAHASDAAVGLFLACYQVGGTMPGATA